MDLALVCKWIGETQVGTQLRESLWVFPIVETVHVLGIALLTGMAAVFDLRLLGWTMRGVRVSEVERRVMPVAWVGAVVMVVTGALLFWAGAEKLYANAAFRWKLGLLVVAGLNPLVFHRGVYRRVAEWDDAERAPWEARVAAVVSLVVWAGIVITGRAIAYL